MANFCLLPEIVKKFREGLGSGEINPQQLAQATSEQRRALLEKFVGKDNAQQVNSLFESKLLLKNQDKGYQEWVMKLTGITTQKKQELLDKIKVRQENQFQRVFDPKEEEIFLKDLAETKLGVGVSQQEAKDIFELTQKLKETKAKMNDDFTWKSKQDGEEYGATKEAMRLLMAELKGKGKGTGLVNPLTQEGFTGKAGAVGTDIKATIKFIAQNTRAFVASFDNSLWGNQGIRSMLDYRFNRIWAADFAKSFKDIAQVLLAKPTKDELFFKGNKRGDEILSAVRAEIYSRKNSLNGRYEMSTPETSKLDIGISEEEFPTSLPARIPVIGRFFKAAEVAYEAGAMRLRADIADKVYDMAEKQGINMSDKFEVGSRNVVVNSITGRGRAKVPDIVNEAAFSVKFTKSQIDFLTVNAIDKLSPSARLEAGKNILSVVAQTAVILGIAKALDPNSTEFDTRSTKFGKIEIGGITVVNLAPGYGGMITLISRIAQQSTKNRSGIVTKLGEGYGVPNGMDVFWDYTENKASPIASIIRDLIRQKTFEGDKPTIGNIAKNSLVAITLESSQEILADKSGNSLLKAIAIGLGYLGTGAGTSNYPTNWNNSTSKEMEQLKAKIGQDRFNQANDRFNQKYNEWLQNTIKSEDYKKKSDEDKQDLISKQKEKIKQEVFKSYNFKPQRETPKTKSGSLFK